jgi:hypothetical protein
MPPCYASILPYVVLVHHYTEQLGCSQLNLLSEEPQLTGLLRTVGLEQRGNEHSRHLGAFAASGYRTKGKCRYRKSIRGIQLLNKSNFLDLCTPHSIIESFRNQRMNDGAIQTFEL